MARGRDGFSSLVVRLRQPLLAHQQQADHVFVNDVQHFRGLGNAAGDGAVRRVARGYDANPNQTAIEPMAYTGGSWYDTTVGYGAEMVRAKAKLRVRSAVGGVYGGAGTPICARAIDYYSKANVPSGDYAYWDANGDVRWLREQYNRKEMRAQGN